MKITCFVSGEDYLFCALETYVLFYFLAMLSLLVNLELVKGTVDCLEKDFIYLFVC